MLSNPQQRGIGYRPVNDTNATADRTVRLLAYTAISAARTVQLAALKTFDASQSVLIADASGNCSGSNTISIVPNGTDTINGSNSALVLNTAYAEVELVALAAGGWIFNSNSNVGPIALLNLLPITSQSTSTAITITSTTQMVYYDASGGVINQALPSIASLAGFNDKEYFFWKVDASTNAVNFSSADGFLGYTSPISLTVQGATLHIKLNTTLNKWMVE